jgi:hypothetical protein
LPVIVLVIDLIGLVLAVIGFHLAFRQEQVRRWWAMLRGARADLLPLTDDDPARYALRIAGMMILAFGVVLAGFFTMAYYSLGG